MPQWHSPGLTLQPQFEHFSFLAGALMKRVTCVSGAMCSSFQIPRSPGLMRPTWVTALASVITASVVSGTISDGQQTWIETTVVGPGPVAFWWMVGSELGYDQFQFLIDGVEQANISGDVSWQQRTFNLPAGVHVVRWAYVKDATDSAGAANAT